MNRGIRAMRLCNAEAQRRRVRRGDGRVEHVERVEGESVSQGAPSLRDGQAIAASLVTAFTLLCSVAGFACAKGVRLPDEQSEELCEAKSQEVERRSPLTHTLSPLHVLHVLHG